MSASLYARLVFYVHVSKENLSKMAHCVMPLLRPHSSGHHVDMLSTHMTYGSGPLTALSHNFLFRNVHILVARNDKYKIAFAHYYAIVYLQNNPFSARSFEQRGNSSNRHRGTTRPLSRASLHHTLRYSLPTQQGQRLE